MLIADSSSISGNQCMICGKVFATPGSAKRHFNMTHLGDSDVKSPPCMVCGKRFKHLQTLKDHLRKIHQVYQAQYEKVYGDHKAHVEWWITLKYISNLQLWNRWNKQKCVVHRCTKYLPSTYVQLMRDRLYLYNVLRIRSFTDGRIFIKIRELVR